MSQTADHAFDVAIVDKDDRTIAFVQVKTSPPGRQTSIPPEQLRKLAEHAAFFLAIDPQHVSLYQLSGESLGVPLVQLDTQRMLQNYDPEFPQKRVIDRYLLTLTEAWLRDLAYHWKSPTPPGSEELARTGLLEKIAGGTTLPLGA